MSDKSFGDCPSRNIVKNPLLSTAVTGLSIEDLTHNAVLVPVAATQGLITRSEPHIGTNTQTLAHSEHEFTNFPSGDSNTNVFSPQTTASAYPPSLDHPHHIHHDKQTEITSSTVSKASVKSEDDFDVNEYFARLQGTRYVSAPINSNPDQNANLAATEDNLEEINLNDDKQAEVQQSLTADIAQNFSQLPTVLPHVASAVFSSFSNMLNYKSREQTPDERQSYQEVPYQTQAPPGPMHPGQNLAVDTPLMAEDVVKDVAPPPKEPPISGSTNFRITTKKKYAQIPGLSSGHNFETAQKIELNPLTKNSEGYFIPNINKDSIDSGPKDTASQENNPPVPNPPSSQASYNIFNPVNKEVRASDFQPTPTSIPKEIELKPIEERLPPPPPTYASLYGENTASYPANPIAPPPMFSTQRRDSQTGKAVLPPSVARRIGSNHPVIKSQVMQAISTDNIFVPTFDPTAFASEAQPIGSSFSDVHSQPELVTQQPPSRASSQGIQDSLPPTNLSSIPPPAQFLPQPPPGFGAQPLVPSTSVIAPPSKAPPKLPAQLAPPSNPVTNKSAPSKLPQAMTSNMFVPSFEPVDARSSAGTESLTPLSNIFSPKPPVAAPSLFAPGQTQSSVVGSSPNVGPPSFFTQKSTTNAAPSFYNPEKPSEESKLGQPFVSESSKPLMEPPKSTGAVNFRMNKKRPQYYSGPIEGVGSISNNIKPVIPSIHSGAFQGALFTPEHPKADQNVPSSMPFDISKQTETTPLVTQYNTGNLPMNVPPPTAFDVGQPTATYHHFDINQPVQHNQQQFTTAFDLSRPTTESYEQQEETKESIGFGIIGSLKSKLSNIDINKIQHSVTTFFDPAYKDTQNEDSSQKSSQQNVPYSSVPYQTQGAETNLEIFVPNVQQNIPAYNYQQHKNAIYMNDQYYKYPNFQNQGQPAAGHCSDHHHYPHSKGYTDETQNNPDTATNANILQSETTKVPSQGDSIESPPKLQNEAPTIGNNQIIGAERNVTRNVTGFDTKIAQKVQDVTSIEQKSAINFFDMAASNFQEPIGLQQSNLTIVRPVVPNVPQERTYISDSFKQTKPQEIKSDAISFFEPKTVDLFAAGKENNEEKTVNLFANTKFDDRKIQNISNYVAQNVNLIGTSNERVDDNSVKQFASMPADLHEATQKIKDDVTKTHSNVSGNMFDSKEIIIPKDSLLDSLSKDDVPILGVSSVPLFGLSTIPVEKSKEFDQKNDLMTSLSDKSSSMSFFDHPQKFEEGGAKTCDILNRKPSFSFFENVGTPQQKDDEYDQDKNQEKSGSTSESFYENVDSKIQVIKGDILENIDKDQSKPKEIDKETADDIDKASELSICETCREVTHLEGKVDDQDVTTQLIENITSPIQLSNPVEALLSDTDQQEPTNTDQVAFDAGQFDEISHITEETIDTINVQSATELLEDVDEIKSMNYGWANESALKQDYNFNVDLNPVGFYGNNSLFFDKVATNADEIKHQENLLARQMSAPSAPPAEEDGEEDTKSDEAGILDVHSIEQDANKDFPLFEEFVIEPEDDDYKEKTEGDLDSFTNRVEKFKNKDSTEATDQPSSLFFDLPPPPISMVSYFDTGNYAVETHYRNTNTMPASTISIPPGFEEEFYRRLALAKQREETIKNDMKKVPETSTQTRPTSVTTYSVSRIAPIYTMTEAIGSVGFNVEANITSLVDEQSEQEFPTSSSSNLVKSIENIVNDQNKKAQKFPTASVLKSEGKDSPEEPAAICLKTEDKLQSKSVFDTAPVSKLFGNEKQILPDAITAFSSHTAEKKETVELEQTPVSTAKPVKPETKLPDPINFFADTASENPPETFNRLASYFSSPPKTEHAKSFFELSQSQNHYRHASSAQKSKINDLMKDLTSVQNINVSKDQIIRHVNYFTVEYDTVLPEFSKGDIKNEKVDLTDDDKLDFDSVVSNCRYCTQIFNSGFKVRTAMNENNDTRSTTPKMEPHKEAGRGSVTVNFDGLTIHEETNEGIMCMNENRTATEYTPVKHHWFYRVDVEDKSIWRGFSVVDSRALETTYLSPDLNEQTLVATDGGRYDVNVMGRLRIPVYWSDKPTNVRRCSWFYKGTTDARYVPYTEAVAEKLEEEYRHGMTTGEWHRRLVIPNGEVVVMHGPSVMVHFLHSDAFSTPPQSSSRPRVVRRGHDESEIEDTEPSSIDHLLLLCHGVGSACDMRFRSVEEVVEDFRATSLQLIQSHYRNSYDQGIVSRVEVLPISWHATLHSGETGVDRRLSQITLDSIPRLRSFTNDTVLDVLFYTSPVFCQTIMDTVCTELNRIYELFVQRNPSFKGGVSLGGHSLGSVILYDLLCHQADAVTEDSKSPADKQYVRGSAGTGQPCVRYPRLAFSPDALYALGSPIAIFECIRGVESLGASFSLPTCKNFFNIFHPYDPIAYRIEPLIDPRLRDLKPFLIPHHKGRKRMHLELKDTMARVGADLKQKLLESLRCTWNKWKAQPPTDGQLEKVVEEELEKERLSDDIKEEIARESELSTPDILGSLNGGRRVDYVLQEAPLEMINEYLFAMSSHVGYWESEDTMLLMLREIYSALGVEPDSTIPQQNMTVQRTRTGKQEDAIVLNASEYPSTSHGPI